MRRQIRYGIAHARFVPPQPVAALVPKCKPLFLEKHLKSLTRAVIRVEAKLCQGRELGCAIPSVGAVHAAASLVAFNFIHHQSSAAQQPPYKTEPASSHLQQIIINKSIALRRLAA